MQEYTQTKKFMGTDIIITLVSPNLKTVDRQELFQIAYDQFDLVVKKYTRFNQTSELSVLNMNAGSWHTVSKEFFELIEFMHNLHKQTNGLFDPTVIDFLEIYGYKEHREFDKFSESELEKLIYERAKKRPSFLDTKLDSKNLRVQLPHDCRIDLGSIGKGFAIDLAFNSIQKIDMTVGFLINAGGDIRVFGLNTKEENWEIELKDKENNIGVVSLNSGEALCSSGSWAKKYKSFHHIISPKSGQPSQAYRTSFVKGKNAMEADAWATILLLGGEKYLPEDSHLEIFLV